MKKSRTALQQEALAGSAEVPPARPRGRPKTRLSTLDETAAYLHVSHATIYRLIESKHLPHFRIGYVLRFDLPTVLAWAANFTADGDQLRWQDSYPAIKARDLEPE